MLALPGPQRVPYVEQIRVVYPRWNDILTEIAACHVSQPYAAEPPCLLLLGPTGAGKSTLISSYAQRYPRVVTATSVSMPVVRAAIPVPATIKNMLEVLLRALGDPRAANGTIGGMTLRLVSYFKDCGVQLLILDELQHFYDKDNQRVLLMVSDWLKRFIKEETKVACVLVGLEEQADQIVNANSQLARLFGDPYSLAPFQWDEAQPETVKEFRTFLMQLESLLPLHEPSNLANRERAWRCFVACGGVTAYLMALIRHATTSALRANREHLDDILLMEAFDKRLAGKRRGIPNPFIGDPPLPPQRDAAPLAASDLPVTGRQGRPRKPRSPKTRDVLHS